MKKSFNELCYDKLKKVPKEKVTTYKELARALGTKAYREVGNAMNKNHHKDVQCHRVTRSDGEVGGFAHGTKNKIKILKSEDIEISNGKINLSKYIYKFK